MATKGKGLNERNAPYDVSSLRERGGLHSTDWNTYVALKLVLRAPNMGLPASPDVSVSRGVSVCLSVYLSGVICRSVYLRVCVSVCLSVCMLDVPSAAHEWWDGFSTLP